MGTRLLSRATATRGTAAVASSLTSTSSSNHSAANAAFAATQARYHSSHEGQEAAGRLRDALEQYRVKNSSREIPSRFKREIAAASTPTASLSSSSLAITTGGAERRASDRTIAVEGIETM